MATFIPVQASGAGSQSATAGVGLLITLTSGYDAIEIACSGANCRMVVSKSAVLATSPTTTDYLLRNGDVVRIPYRRAGYGYIALEPGAGTATIDYVYGQLISEEG